MDSRRDPPVTTLTLQGAAEQWTTPKAITGGANSKRKERGAGGHDPQEQVQNWSTPKASDGDKGGPNMRGSKGDWPLPAQAAHWPTPRTVQGGYTRDGGDPTKERLTLAGQAEQWPTPQTNGTKSARAMTASTSNGKRSGGGQSSPPGLEQLARIACGDMPEEMQNIALPVSTIALIDHLLPDRPTPSGPKSSETRRRLNPLFVEWLMGWPEGLSGFDTAGTASCRSPQPLPGCDCMDCWLTTQRALLSQLLTIEPPAQGNLL